MIARGVDPVTEKKNRKIEMSLKNLQTFEAVANAWIAFKGIGIAETYAV